MKYIVTHSDSAFVVAHDQEQVDKMLAIKAEVPLVRLKAISGLLKPEEGRVTAGSVQCDGHRIENGDPETIARLGIIQVMEGRRILEHLTVEENLIGGALIRRRPGERKADLEMVYSYFPRLHAVRHQISGYVSGGEQQMMVIGRALMARRPNTSTPAPPGGGTPPHPLLNDLPGVHPVGLLLRRGRSDDPHLSQPGNLVP